MPLFDQAALNQGVKKREVYDLARAGVPPLTFRIAAILQQSRVPVSIYWSA